MKGKPNIMRVVANKEMISSSLSILHMIKNHQDEGFITSGFNENELENKKCIYNPDGSREIIDKEVYIDEISIHNETE